ncbi:hypothetical protein BZG23_11270 [Salinivibrio sp. ML290]|nr:hypothetical protein BZG23_11270 [Salinivibrio sp. ML290]
MVYKDEVEKKKYVFLSMPPFHNFKFFLNPRRSVILDIRDGWSIAQATGYGGNVKCKPLKSIFTRQVERFLIRRAFLTITCTNGLHKYLEEISSRNVILIPNGISGEDYKRAQSLKAEKKINEGDELVFCCAGKFSEYGPDKVEKLCLTIMKRYSSKKIKIQLIGSNEEKNIWLDRFLREKSGGQAYLDIVPRKSRESLYEVMARADYGMTILRDPSYEFGTKIYDYIALGLPVVNYFDKPNNFTDYFDACLDIGFGRNNIVPEIRRDLLIEQGLKDIDF